MGAYTVTLAGTATIPSEWWVGTLAGGYFVTVDATVGSMYLRTAANPTVAIGTTAGTAYYPSTMAANDVGDLYWIDTISATSMGIHQVAESGGALSVTNNGTATVVSSGFFEPALTHDGTQLMGRYTTPVSGVTTATAGSALTLDVSGVTNANPRGMSAPDRALTFDYTNIDLWDATTDTVLDSITDALFDAAFNNVRFAPYGAYKTFFVCPVGTSPEDFIIGVLDATGDVLSFDWGPTTVTTDWDISGVADCEVAVWGDVGTFIPRKDASPQTASLYVVDLLTGQVSSSSPTTAMLAGVEDQSLGFAGPNTIVAFHGSDAWTFWTVAGVPPDPTTYRPIGKSMHLRQRQTPYIT